MTHIPYNASIAQKKPNTLINRQKECPFCQDLSNHIVLKESDSSFYIIKNRFEVLPNTLQTVIVETNNCEEHMGIYSKKHLVDLLTFTFDYYEELKKTGEFKSILLFKNYGIQACGSIHHSHSQIIGFKDIDCYENVKSTDFDGIAIEKKPGIEWNLSTFPVSEMYEFNIIMTDLNKIDIFADYLQTTIQYILTTINPMYKCYNISFYLIDGSIVAKVIPRKPNSVLLIAYGIKQVPTNLEQVCSDLRKTF